MESNLGQPLNDSHISLSPFVFVYQQLSLSPLSSSYRLCLESETVALRG